MVIPLTHSSNSRRKKPNTFKTGLELYSLEPANERQEKAFDAFDDGFNLLLTGPAGTGKTLVAMYLALDQVVNSKEFNRVVIMRSACQIRDLGFLPGTMKEKIALYEEPYIDACSYLYGRDDAYVSLKNHGVLEFTTTSYIRGMNLRNCVLIMDEASNYTMHECDSAITRIADNSRLIVCGDSKQSDLLGNDKGGFDKFCTVLKNMKSFHNVEFLVEDVRRSEIVREYLEARNTVLKW